MSSTSSTTGRPTPPSTSRPAPPSTGGSSTSRPAPPSSGSSSSSRPAPPSSRDDYSSSRPTPPSTSRPTPPSTGGYDRPTPPSTGGYDRPTPPSTGGYDRPTPPPVHEPRYYWQPTFPIILPSDPRPVPRIALPPAPAPARKVELSEVSTDVFGLLGEYGRLREKKKTLFITTHPKLDANEAKERLASGQPIYLAPDGGMNSASKYKEIKSAKELDSLLPSVREQKRGDLQANENRAYERRVDSWVEQDIQRRIGNMPAFNSIYDTNRLTLNNYMVSAGGRSFNRNLLTAMNVYNQSSTQREIATRWHNNPEMGTAEFNRMANQVITEKISRLYWQADYMGDYGTYLGTNPVPGLRYPDTQEDVDYNADVIRRVAAEVPMLLNSAVND